MFSLALEPTSLASIKHSLRMNITSKSVIHTNVILITKLRDLTVLYHTCTFCHTADYFLQKNHIVHNLRQSSTYCSLLYECENCNFGGKCMLIYVGGCVFQ